jgi:hypothetical protein
MVRRICFLIVLLATLPTVTSAFAQSREEQAEVLRGLEGVYVVVGRIKPEIERDGLYGSMLQDDAEFMLRTAGVKVLSEEEWLSAPGNPYLNLNVDAFKYCDGYVYKIGLRIVEKVHPVREPTLIEATTLSMRDDLGITPSLSAIREQTRDLLEKFTEVWRTANPKQAQKKPPEQPSTTPK